MFRVLYDPSVFATFYDEGVPVTVLNDSGQVSPWAFRIRMVWEGLRSYLEWKFPSLLG